MLIIGDVHNKYDEYKKIISQYSSSIQIGDMGFDYTIFEDESLYSHKFFGGNHDNYGSPGIEDCFNNLGNYGIETSRGLPFFFVRGAYSVDKNSRIEGVSWWKEEELNYEQGERCLDVWSRDPQDVVLSHDCPQIVVDMLWGYPKTYTRKLLDAMYKIRQPKIWVFGHHHKSINVQIGRTKFICLNELETLELTSNSLRV